MGAWGPEPFEDDSTLDALTDLIGALDPIDAIQSALEGAVDAGYLDYDQGAAVLAAAAVVDAFTNGTRYGEAAEDLDAWCAANSELDLKPLRVPASLGLKRLLDADSELSELWAENDELSSRWRQNVQQILARLT